MNVDLISFGVSLYIDSMGIVQNEDRHVSLLKTFEARSADVVAMIRSHCKANVAAPR
jgi:hypothetical protein